jgi:hypothetical protein
VATPLVFVTAVPTAVPFSVNAIGCPHRRPAALNVAATGLDRRSCRWRGRHSVVAVTLLA